MKYEGSFGGRVPYQVRYQYRRGIGWLRHGDIPTSGYEWKIWGMAGVILTTL